MRNRVMHHRTWPTGTAKDDPYHTTVPECPQRAPAPQQSSVAPSRKHRPVVRGTFFRVNRRAVSILLCLLILALTGCGNLTAELKRTPDGTWSGTLRDGGAVVGVQVANQAAGEATVAELAMLVQAWAKATKSNSAEDWAEVWRIGRVVAANARQRAFASRRGLTDTIHNSNEADPWSD